MKNKITPHAGRSGVYARGNDETRGGKLFRGSAALRELDHHCAPRLLREHLRNLGSCPRDSSIGGIVSIRGKKDWGSIRTEHIIQNTAIFVPMILPLAID